MIKRFILHLLANAGALYFVSQILSNDFAVTGGLKGYLIAALIFGTLNTLVKPILKILSFPLILITVGLFHLVLNMFMIWLAEYALDILEFNGVGIVVEGLGTYFMAGLLLTLANFFIHWLTQK